MIAGKNILELFNVKMPNVLKITRTTHVPMMILNAGKLNLGKLTVNGMIGIVGSIKIISHISVKIKKVLNVLQHFMEIVASNLMKNAGEKNYYCQLLNVKRMSNAIKNSIIYPNVRMRISNAGKNLSIHLIANMEI